MLISDSDKSIEWKPTKKIKKKSQKLYKHPSKKENKNRKTQFNRANMYFKANEDFFNNRQTNFLKFMCSDSHVCIAFGNETNNINNFFDEFNNFSLLSENPVSIGSKSANGFLKMLTFEKNGYVANAILKSNQKPTADNLVYEGLVGLFLNKKGKLFPCFLETYGIYQYNPKLYKYFKDKDQIEKDKITKHGLNKIKINNTNFSLEACDNSLHKAVLIQHIKDATTLSDLLELNKNDHEFMENELLYILFQIYIPLSQLAKKFTHYDLHANNVLLYTPSEHKYIIYHYHLNNGLYISFKSKYIVKIIDYGRSYFGKNNSELGNSLNIYNQVKNNCPKGNYGFFVHVTNNLLPYKKNESYDLRLITILKYANEKKYPDFLVDFFNKVTNFKIENTTSGLPTNINNVHDAATDLIHIVQNQKTNHDKYYKDLDTSVSKLGDLHIFTDGKPIVFHKYIDDIQNEINQKDTLLYPKIKKTSSKHKIKKSASPNKTKSPPKKNTILGRLTSIFTRKKK